MLVSETDTRPVDIQFRTAPSAILRTQTSPATDTFTYLASDGLGGTAMATVILNVVPLGHPVVNVTDAGGTYHGTPFPATATLTAPGNAPVSSLDGVSPTLAYYAGSLTAAQVAAAIPLPGAAQRRRNLHGRGYLPGRHRICTCFQ